VIDLKPKERRHFQKQFAMTLANLAQVRVYWCQATRRITARKTVSTRRLELPSSCVLIGTYTHPFNSGDFIGDLDDLLAKLAVDAAA
jgi:hypothetical protein